MIATEPITGHTRDMPAGGKIASTLYAYWTVQLSDVIKQFHRQGWAGTVDLSHWDESLAHALAPLLVPFLRRGVSASRQLRGDSPPDWTAKTIRKEGAATARLKRAVDTLESLLDEMEGGAIDMPPGIGWGVLQSVRMQPIILSEALNQKSGIDATQAIADVRSELDRGLLAGDGVTEMTRRLAVVFHDRDRAERIARTESSRAMHYGQLAEDIESGVVRGKRWLAASDGCGFCRKLEELGEVPIGDAFIVLDNGPIEYRTILVPPAHPHCRCTYMAELEEI